MHSTAYFKLNNKLLVVAFTIKLEKSFVISSATTTLPLHVDQYSKVQIISNDIVEKYWFTDISAAQGNTS